jgi:hypothetical protein
MAVSLDNGVRRLEAALGLLEAAVTRRLEAERRRGDLETELQIMQDDRARLAVEPDGTVARLHRVEATASDVGRRVERAAGVLREVLGRVEANGAA